MVVVKTGEIGGSLVAQWLGFGTVTVEARVGEPSRVPRGAAKI